MCGRMQFLLKETMPKDAKSLNGNIIEHVWTIRTIYYLLSSHSLPDFPRNLRHGHIGTALALLHDASGLCTIHLP